MRPIEDELTLLTSVPANEDAVARLIVMIDWHLWRAGLSPRLEKTLTLLEGGCSTRHLSPERLAELRESAERAGLGEYLGRG
jgi:hypothetical protein